MHLLLKIVHVWINVGVHLPIVSDCIFVSLAPEKGASRNFYDRLVYKHHVNQVTRMLRGAKFLSLILIAVFIASAFFIPYHSSSVSNAASSRTSELSPMGSFSNTTSLSPFSPPSLPDATFNENGLPSGTSWTVSISGHTYSSNNNSMEVSLPAGIYNYSVTNSLGYFTPSPSGSLNLQTSGQIVSTIYLGKFAVNKFLDLETGKLLGSSSGLSTSQSVLPVYGTYDNYSHVFLVAGYSSSTIYEINPVNYSVMGNISISGSPLSLAFNPANGLIYVVNGSALLKISPTGGILDSITLPSSPTALAFDPANGQVFVAGSDGGIQAYDGSSLAAVATLASISEFDTQGFAYNSALGQMEVVDNSGSNGYVAFLNSQDSVVSTLQVPGTILALVYDAALNVSLTTSISGNTPYAYIISGSHLTRVSGSANSFGLGIDYGTGMGIATNLQNSSVLLLNLTTGNVVYTVNTGGTPLKPLTLPGSSGMLIIDPNYDALDVVPLGYVVREVSFLEHGISPIQNWGIKVNGYTANSVTSSALLYEAPGNYTYAPLQVSGYSSHASGNFSVSDSNVYVNVNYSKTYSIQFMESGLKAGTQWGVTFDGNTLLSNSGDSVSFVAVNGTYNFSVGNVTGYAVSPQNGLIKVSGSGVSVYLNFSMKSYLVNFTSTGLPESAQWYISINGVGHLVNGPEFNYVATPGSYNYSIQPIAGYYPQVAGGSLEVGHNLTVDVNWLPFLYKVNFDEELLPVGTIWTVILSNGASLSSNSSNVSAYLQNGTYTYSFTSSNTSWKGYHGTFVVDGAPISEFLNFTEVLYKVMFFESGIPAGTDWTVNLNTETHGSIYNNVTFSLTNGTYAYTASSTNDSYAAFSGLIQVNGGPVTKDLNFTFKNANVTFHENGLPKGAEWGVYIVQNANFTSNEDNLTISLPYGSYAYLPLTVSGFNSTNISVSFSLGPGSQNLTINVTYNPLPTQTHYYNITVMEVGLPEGLEWAVSYNGTVVPAFPEGTFNFYLANGSYNFTFMALNHKGKELPGSLTATLQVNGTSQDLLVLYYGPYVWMVFDFPLTGSGHSDHNGHNHQHKDHHNVKDSVPEAARSKSKLF